MNKYNFLDNGFDGFFNKAYAIEPEISKEYYDSTIRSIHRDIHSESCTIKELIHLHRAKRETVKEVSDKLTEFYKDKFPLGSDKRLSGGVHFHIFAGDYKPLDGKKLKLKLLNCPLFCKIRGVKLYSRPLTHRSNFNGQLGVDVKRNAVTYKSSYHSHRTHGHPIRERSIEFRCNNVFDYRLYGYYVGVMIASKEGVKFKKTTTPLRDYVSVGNNNVYDARGDILISTINGYRISEEDFIAIRKNIIIILKLLQEHSLINTARDFLSYANEYGFNIKLKIGYLDSFTGITLVDGFKIESINLFKTKLTDLHFETIENFYLFIQNKLKEKMKAFGVPQDLITISIKEIEKRYKKYIPEEVLNKNSQGELSEVDLQQTTLFNNQEELCQVL